AAEAAKQPSIHHVCVVDEMNLARVEQYFAEVLSRIEDRREVPGGGLRSGPLLTARPPGEEVDSRWAGVALPENLALVGTVNMDETTHGFSRKVLDRAFSLEISDIDLARWKPAAAAPPAVRPWPAAALRPRAIRLGGLSLRGEEEKLVTKAVGALVAVNEVLRRAELQVGYRVRDEIALFLLHAHEVKDAFVTRADKGKKGEDVDPLDLALVMKILPRIAGGSGAVRDVVARRVARSRQAGARCGRALPEDGGAARADGGSAALGRVHLVLGLIRGAALRCRHGPARPDVERGAPHAARAAERGRRARAEAAPPGARLREADVARWRASRDRARPDDRARPRPARRDGLRGLRALLRRRR